MYFAITVSMIDQLHFVFQEVRVFLNIEPRTMFLVLNIMRKKAD